MKRILALALALVLLLCGCGDPAETTVNTTTAAPTTETTSAPTTEPTTVPTTEPAPVYFNPLNGEILEEPFTGRIYASTISNIRDALPHVGVMEADILMEMFVNGSVIRCLALFTDISDVHAIGSIRSTRLMFNDITEHYNAILFHAGGASTVLRDARERGITNFNVDSLDRQADPICADTAYRDKEYKRGLEHSLFANGPGILAYVESQGMEMTQPADKDYCLTFVEDGRPVEGEDADRIHINITYSSYHKQTVMMYDADANKYIFNQYDMEMRDQITGELEAFTNVIVMYTNISKNGIFHVADFLAGGKGYYANGGKIVPITWTCDSETSPFRFLTEDGQQLNLGMGNTYIAICAPDSAVTYETVEPVPETTAETLSSEDAA